MITYEDQMELFRLISTAITMDVECWAFGGTAMMFYGYKDETKDADLLFEKEAQCDEFKRVLEKMGYFEKPAVDVYVPEKFRDKRKPIMMQRYDSRFDIFVKKIFKTVLSQRMRDEVYSVHDFKGKHNFRVNVLRKEFIVLLKAVTERQNDFDDIRNIVEMEKNFDWRLLIEETIWQYRHGDSWVLFDVEKAMKELKKYVFIEGKYIKQLHEASEASSG